MADPDDISAPLPPNQAPETTPERAPTHGAALTIKEAARACAVAHVTIRRALDAQKFSSAYRGDGPRGPGTGPWLIPVTDLLSAGYHPNAPELGDVSADEVVSEGSDTPSAPLSWEAYASLRERLARAEEQARSALSIAEERAQTIEVLREALRRVPELPPAPERQPVSEVPPEHPRRGFWRRFFGVAEPGS